MAEQQQDYQCEVCVTSVYGCAVAERCGADRVELCSALSEGGLTPSAGLIALCRQTLAVTKLHVLIRPRAGDFLYDGDELRVMGADLVQAQNLGADGVVLGCLRADGTLDLANIVALLSDVGPHTAVTLHRAFDWCKTKSRRCCRSWSLMPSGAVSRSKSPAS